MMKSRRIGLALLSSAFALLLAPRAALAQDAAPPPPPGGAPTAAPPPPPGAPAAPAGDDAEFAGLRFRWGVTATGGIMVGGASGGAGGIDARFGAQITDMIGVYAQPVFVLGVGTSGNSAANVSASAIAMYGVGALGDFTFGDIFYVAGGLGVVDAAFASAGNGTSNSAGSGAFFTIPTRLGVVLGSKKPERRKGFTIGLDMPILFTPGSPVLIPMLSLGYESF